MANPFAPTQVVGEDGLRPCGGKCKRRLPAKAFSRSTRRPDGLDFYCRECKADYQAEWTLMRNFGLTKATYDRMLADQGGGCAICGKEFGMIRAGKRLRLAVDHDHLTGAVRGILCADCNRGIGMFKDDPRLLQAAVDYISNKGA